MLDLLWDNLKLLIQVKWKQYPTLLHHLQFVPHLPYTQVKYVYQCLISLCSLLKIIFESSSLRRGRWHQSIHKSDHPCYWLIDRFTWKSMHYGDGGYLDWCGDHRLVLYRLTGWFGQCGVSAVWADDVWTDIGSKESCTTIRGCRHSHARG